ncbi:MAG: hypothetical protein E7058_06425 [Lentisphaerae bacterium]|nr:hypothetical protein [Lentisphaerota bacterium]
MKRKLVKYHMFIVEGAAALALLMLTSALLSGRNADAGAKRAACVNNLKTLSYCLLLYCEDNDNNYPAGHARSELLPMLKIYEINDRIFVCPESADGKPDYAYLLAGIDLKISRLTHPEVLPVIICRKHGKNAVIAFADGHVETCTVPQENYSYENIVLQATADHRHKKISGLDTVLANARDLDRKTRKTTP